jgi:hypothetical protein
LTFVLKCDMEVGMTTKKDVLEEVIEILIKEAMKSNSLNFNDKLKNQQIKQRSQA